MPNRILSARVENWSLDPVQAELRVVVTPEAVTPTTEVRGRLLGPGCAYASTVEIAYPLLPPWPGEAAVPGTLGHRVVIPEPVLWDPVGPFLYSGPVELWQDGVRADRVAVRHGLCALSVGPQGLRANGRPLVLRGRHAAGVDEKSAPALRADGVNLLAVAGDVSEETHVAAERFGFFLLAGGTYLLAPGARLAVVLDAGQVRAGDVVLGVVE